ncbi:ferritin-like domain-containing protein [Tuberibacillus sp. Marseille-P3662]|uniref:ferritin-like domain-containing protein n=1 Tax=Tuberibacillus sp. Marseille-P3662 TaxID=1965358 RepID=UPI000A1CA3EE|nr:ferritin-like domain-containing protein [Tuberibacillus sp. Marseille-P3662]
MDQNMKQLIKGLNEDLANEYSSVIMYTHFAATVSGIDYKVLKPFFESEIPDEQGHALYLADKIATLGGEPTTEPAPIEKAQDVESMLKVVHQAESDTIKRYEKRREQAESLGLTELVVKLEDMIADETKHKEETERILKNPSHESFTAPRS